MFHGSIAALVTPMHIDGTIDYPRWSELIEWHIANHTDGLVVLGTTGESPSITTDERERLIKTAVAQVRDRIPVIVGTGTNSTQHTIALTQQAMELGASAALLVTPYYNKPTQPGLLAHFQAIAEAVALPQILYNVPSRTSCDLLPETTGELSQLSNIVAIKEASVAPERLSQLKPFMADIDVFTGNDINALTYIQGGAKGVISVAANVVPLAMHNFCASLLQGDQTEAERYHALLAELFKQLFVQSNPIPCKWLLSELGLIEPGIRLPLVPLEARYQAALKDAWQVVATAFKVQSSGV